MKFIRRLVLKLLGITEEEVKLMKQIKEVWNETNTMSSLRTKLNEDYEKFTLSIKEEVGDASSRMLEILKTHAEKNSEDVNEFIAKLIEDKVERKLYVEFVNREADLDKKYKDRYNKLKDEKIFEPDLQAMINGLIKNNIELDSYRFNKKIQLASLRNGRNLDDIMSTLEKFGKIITENYIINTYKKKDDSGYIKGIIINAATRRRDLNKIYDLLMEVISHEFILEDVASFINITSVSGKEFIVVTCIESHYHQGINIMLDSMREANEEIFENQFIPDPEHQKPKEIKDLENKIDDIFNTL